MSASFHNVQGWLRWYRVHNTVEVVGLAYLFVLLVNEHSYGHGIAVIALLAGVSLLVQAGNRRNLKRFLAKPVLTAVVDDVIDAPVDPHSGEGMTILENGINGLAVLFLAVSSYFLVASWTDMLVYDQRNRVSSFDDLRNVAAFLVATAWVITAAPLLLFLVRQFGVRVESAPG